MRNGSLALADYPGDVVHIECERCGRTGRYRLDGLLGALRRGRGAARRLDVAGLLRMAVAAVRGEVHGSGAGLRGAQSSPDLAELPSPRHVRQPAFTNGTLKTFVLVRTFAVDQYYVPKIG